MISNYIGITLFVLLAFANCRVSEADFREMSDADKIEIIRDMSKGLSYRKPGLWISKYKNIDFLWERILKECPRPYSACSDYISVLTIYFKENDHITPFNLHEGRLRKLWEFHGKYAHNQDGRWAIIFLYGENKKLLKKHEIKYGVSFKR